MHLHAIKQQDDQPLFQQLVSSETAKKLKQEVCDLPQLILSERQLCDVELILNGGFFPLSGFMTRADYNPVLEQMRLADGTLWPMPITLDVDEVFRQSIQLHDRIALRDPEGLLIAVMQIDDCWKVDKQQETLRIFATEDDTHPAVYYLKHHAKDYYIGGKLFGIALPHHYDFQHLRFTPDALRAAFRKKNWQRVVAFQTRNPMHRAHHELTLRAAEKTQAKILIHPVVGMTKPGDIEYYTRVRCYEHIMQSFTEDVAALSLLPLAMRMGGPREAMWHAIIRRNYGCTHFIVGRDHAGPGKNRDGQLFYDPYAAQTLVLQHQEELGIEIVPFQEMVFSHQQQKYFAINEFPKDEIPATISGTELREKLITHQEIPEWFSYPKVIEELRQAHPPRDKQGFTILLTGLPSAGKSTIANALLLKLREKQERQITLLDGDIIRTHLSRGLGFSIEDRETNILRVGFVAREVTRHGGIAICALVAPFAATRKKMRDMIEEVGGFIEVYVATPLAVCELRDRKGLYKKAREGVLKQFTGVSDPYENPTQPEIKIDTSLHEPEDMIAMLMKHIQLAGYIHDAK